MSPRQISSEYYNQKQRTILGFGLYYREAAKTKCLNIDIISDVLEQTGYTVVSSFKWVLFTLSKFCSAKLWFLLVHRGGE